CLYKVAAWVDAARPTAAETIQIFMFTPSRALVGAGRAALAAARLPSAGGSADREQYPVRGVGPAGGCYAARIEADSPSGDEGWTYGGKYDHIGSVDGQTDGFVGTRMRSRGIERGDLYPDLAGQLDGVLGKLAQVGSLDDLTTE